MIVFVTDFDGVTQGNKEVICPILVYFSFIELVGSEAISENLVSKLRENPQSPLFVATHGKPTYFQDNNGKPALEKEDVSLLAQRKVYVFACWTANELGRMEWENTTYYGYTGAVSAPDADDMRLVKIQTPIFEYILRNFPTCHDEAAVKIFIEELKNKVDEAEEALDDLFEEDTQIDTSDTNAFLNDVWKKLRVYHNNSVEPIRHQQGFETDIFYEG